MTLTCTACGLVFETPELQKAHHKLDWHRFNLKRKIANLPGVTEEQYEARKAALSQASNKGSKNSRDGYQARCLNCKKNFVSEKALTQHLQSRKHQQVLREYPDSVEQVEVNGVLQGAEQSVSSSLTSGAQGRVFAHKPSQSTKWGASTDETDQAPAPATAKEEDRATAHKDNMNVSDDDGGEDEEDDAESIDLDQINILECIFCSEHSETIDSNVMHMQKMHGFFIPDVEFLTDLEGLLKYLGAKVRFGRICLYCNGKGKTFKTYQDCVKHMTSKSHCKILYEAEEDVAEYEDYYDFSSSYQNADDGDEEEMEVEEVEGDDDDEGWETASDEDDGEEQRERNTKSRAKRKLSIHETGELVLLDGRRVGNRDYRRYYRQNLRPDEGREQVVLNLREKLLLGYKEAGVHTSSALTLTNGFSKYKSNVGYLANIKSKIRKAVREKSHYNASVWSHKLTPMSYR